MRGAARILASLYAIRPRACTVNVDRRGERFYLQGCEMGDDWGCGALTRITGN
jgi:hypothetical protein